MKKPVSFKNTELDKAIWDYAETKMNFSVYVKELILKDMERYKRDQEEIQRQQEVYNPGTTTIAENYLNDTTNDDGMNIQW